MGQRQALQTLLEEVLGNRNVYFQPPPSTKMQYPCIVYHRDDMDIKYAGNKPYKNMKQYQVTMIDPDPDSPFPDLIAKLPMCSFDRHFTADNLNHDVFTLYF